MNKICVWALLFLSTAPATPAACQAGQNPTDDRLLPTSQRIEPAGQLLTFSGRPVDACLAYDGRLLFVKDRSKLRIIDVDSFEIAQSLDLPGGGSLFGIAADSTGKVYVTNAKQSLHVYAPVEERKDESNITNRYALEKSIRFPGGAFPCGVAINSNAKTAYVCLSKRNQLAVVDLHTGKVSKVIPVGIAPFGVALDEAAKRICVSSIGGRLATDKDLTATSAGTATVVDERGIASTGLLSVIELEDLSVVGEYSTGRHPSALQFVSDGEQLLCANSNDDTLTLIDFGKSMEKEIAIKPALDLPFGSMPAALAMDARTGSVFVALAGNNAVAKVRTQ